MTEPRKPVRGMRFVHRHRLDPTWVPGPGQKYVHAPKQIMEITRVTYLAVWFKPVDAARATDFLSRDEFEAQYGDRLMDARRG